MARRRRSALRCAIRRWRRRSRDRGKPERVICRRNSGRHRQGGAVALKRRAACAIGLHFVPSQATRTDLHRLQAMACVRLSAALIGRHRGGADARRYFSSRNIARCAAGQWPAASSSRNPMPCICFPRPGAWRLPIAACTLLTATSSKSMSRVCSILLPEAARAIDRRSQHGHREAGRPAGHAESQPPKTHRHIRALPRTSRWSTASAMRCR